MTPPDKKDGWEQWGKYVLKELERLNACYTSLDKNVTDVKVEIARLKVKSGVWGAIGGVIPVAIGLGIWAIKSL